MIDESTQRSEEGLALLERAAVPVVPEGLRSGVRLAVEERLSARGRWSAARRLLLAVAASLLAGSALAYGLSRWHSEPPAALVVPPPVRRPSIRPLAVPSAPRPVPPSRSPVRVRQVARVAPLSLPEQAGLPDSWRVPVDPEEQPPAPAPPRLVIRRAGRPDVSLVLAGDRVVGQVRGRPVSLTITSAQILGKLGDQNVWLWMHGHEAEGQVAGAPVRFEIAETPRGQALREGYVIHGALPAQATRIVASDGELSWFPGCEAALPLVEPDAYQGRCSSGREARVVVPESWRRLPLLPRLILLSFFLTERDPLLDPLFR